MPSVIQAEFLKLTSRRSLLTVGIFLIGFAVVASLTVFLSASDDPGPSRGANITLDSLSSAGGATQAFAVGASFAGFLTFVLLTANIAGEFAQGTFRTVLMRQPSRAKVLFGKVAGLITFIAVLLLAAMALTVAVSYIVAPGQDVSTGEWLTLDGLGEAARDYGLVLIAASAWTTYALLLAVVLRSIPLALGIGIAWSGPFEHLMVDAVSGVSGWFPGLLLESLASGGTDDVSLTRALLMTGIYMVGAATAALAIFTRRDVTG